ncbi:MAG TPA: hypothetical protein VM686_06820 [Polyangiaceae bacterium]|nr:hypothetical protein [Polyangiaceae bacterium]
MSWLVLAVAGGCGETSKDGQSPGVTPGGAGEAGASAADGGASGATNAAGAGGEAGEATLVGSCPVPVDDWDVVEGDVFFGTGNMVASADWIVASTQDGTVLLPIDPQAPEAMMSPVPLDVDIGSPESVWQGADALYVLGGTMDEALIARVETSGAVTTAPIPGMLRGPGITAVALAGERVAVVGGDGSGGFGVYLFDDALQPIGDFSMPMHSFGTVTTDAQGLHLAVINSASDELEFYRLPDAGPELAGSAALPASIYPFALTWVGDEVFLQNEGKMVFIDPAGNQRTLDGPSQDGSSDISVLTSRTTALGTVFAAEVNNGMFFGLLNDGGIDFWLGSTEQSVFADVFASDTAIGAYYVATLRNRALVHVGRRCPD